MASVYIPFPPAPPLPDVFPVVDVITFALGDDTLTEGVTSAADSAAWYWDGATEMPSAGAVTSGGDSANWAETKAAKKKKRKAR